MTFIICCCFSLFFIIFNVSFIVFSTTVFSLFFIVLFSLLFIIVLNYFHVFFIFFAILIIFQCLSSFFCWIFHCFSLMFSLFSLFCIFCHCFSLIRLKKTKTDKIEYFRNPGVTWLQIIYLEAFHCVEMLVCWFSKHVYIVYIYIEVDIQIHWQPDNLSENTVAAVNPIVIST
jgi:hypothetical protein